jgi:hypothetical protein
MPQEWENKFISGGSRFETMDFAKLVAYFRDLEDIARNAQQHQNDGKIKDKNQKSALARKLITTVVTTNSPRTREHSSATRKARPSRSKRNASRTTIFVDSIMTVLTPGDSTVHTRTQWSQTVNSGGDKSKGHNKKAQSFAASLDSTAVET